MEAAQSGRRVYYGTLADLITSLEDAKAAGKFIHRLKTLTYPALLVVDEIGYLPISQTGAMLFFQLINRRYERGSIFPASSIPAGGRSSSVTWTTPWTWPTITSNCSTNVSSSARTSSSLPPSAPGTAGSPATMAGPMPGTGPGAMLSRPAGWCQPR
ncbi:MAG: ATP-binding protein [bacterium]